MNSAALYNFLRHLLFLFVILKLFSSIFFFLQLGSCRAIFDDNLLLPLNTALDIHRALYISNDVFFSLFKSISLNSTALSCAGFFAAIYIKSHELINFGVGLTFILMSCTEFTIGYLFRYIIKAFEDLIYTIMESVYSTINRSLRSESNFTEYMRGAYYIRKEGWSVLISLNHSEVLDLIDFLQITLNCCGPSGPFYWDIPLPESCCPQEFFENCTFMTAFTKSCKYDYGRFHTCLNGLQIQMIFYSLISIVTGSISLYLSYMKDKGADEMHGDAGDDDSSTSTEDNNFLRQNNSM